MPLFTFPPDPDAPDPEPGHALFFGRPLCQTGVRIGPGTAREYDLTTIACPDCRQAIQTAHEGVRP
jgi:hypothetical protein